MTRAFAIMAVAAISVSGCAKAAETARPEAQQEKPGTPAPANPDAAPPPAAAAASPEFSQRLNEYVKLHERLEATLPPLPKETTPAIADKHQRQLASLIQAERKTARRGDIFTPDAERAIKAVLAKAFAGPDGRQLRASIMDENPGEVKLAVNARYPDEIPLSTVPPQVLSALPKLPADVEYRFIGDRLILLDVHAHMIVDYIDNALPA